MEEEELEERSTATRRKYRERQEEARPIVQRRLREVFAASRDQPWEHRLVDTPRTLVRLRRAVRRYPVLVTAHRRTDWAVGVVMGRRHCRWLRLRVIAVYGTFWR